MDRVFYEAVRVYQGQEMVLHTFLDQAAAARYLLRVAEAQKRILPGAEFFLREKQ